MDKLRGSIQTLTRSANPLGKIMDYVQEDLHSMQKERDMWRTENRKLADDIKREMGYEGCHFLLISTNQIHRQFTEVNAHVEFNLLLPLNSCAC